MKNILIGVVWKNLLEYAKCVSIVLFLAGICFSCATEKNVGEECEDCLFIFDFAHDKDASIIGKWKLENIRVNSRSGICCADCSLNNIVYEFKQDGSLTVSGNTDNYGLHESGEYTFIKDEWSLGLDGYPWGLNINKGNTLWYMLSSKKLIIDYSPLDGATLYFVKIEGEKQ